MQEVKYLRSELEYQEEVLSEYHLLFEEYYRRWCGENNVDIDTQEKNNSERIDMIIPKTEEQKHDSAGLVVLEDVKPKQKEGMKKMNKLYRKIAMELHPDKQNGDDKRFVKINEAYENGEWSVLLEEANELGIDPSDFSHLSELLNDEAIKLKERITHNNGIYSWKFYECEEDENCKQNIIKSFLKQLFNLEI